MLLKKFYTLLLHIKKVEIICAIMLFGFIVAIIALQVGVRYILNKPFKWPEELAALLLIYLTFLTADIVYKDKAHISIDYFMSFLPERWKHAVAIVIYVCIAIFLITIIPTSIKLLKMQYGHITAAVITLPKSYWSLPVPIAFFSMLLTTIYFILEEMMKLVKKEH
jgi:TRAP-type C4-dicarboxylate transport system permease small subunit